MKEPTQCSCYGQHGLNMEILALIVKGCGKMKKIEDLEEERNRF